MTGNGTDATAQLLAQLREDVSKLQKQIMSNWTRNSARFRDVTAELAQASAVAGLQAETLQSLERDVAALRESLGDEAGAQGKGYTPVPAPRWWQLEGDELADAVARLRGWVETVYAPGYGRLAERLPHCWPQHPLCLFTLDWLSELHSVLYLQPDRSARLLAAQAEWQTRLLPAAVEQMTDECQSCDHRRSALNGARR